MTDEKTYRLSQVEAVIAALMQGNYRTAGRRNNSKLESGMLHRVRRMLQLDREHGIKVGAKLPEHPMAFFEELPEGKGHPVRLTSHKAFNLVIACELLRFGFNQKEVVEAIGMADGGLRQAFYRSNDFLETATWQRATTLTEGQTVENLRWFLLITGVSMPTGTTKRTEGLVHDGEWIPSLEIVQGQEDAMRRLLGLSNERLQAIGVIELSHLAARVLELLPLQQEAKSGRKTKIR